MPRNGKRFEWEVATESGIPLAKLIQDFDWADEVLHSQIGREWYVTEFSNLKTALSYGDRCWSTVLSQWQRYIDEGRTEHRNWWPELYRAACARWGVTPDPAAARVRSDLRRGACRSEGDLRIGMSCDCRLAANSTKPAGSRAACRESAKSKSCLRKARSECRQTNRACSWGDSVASIFPLATIVRAD